MKKVQWILMITSLLLMMTCTVLANGVSQHEPFTDQSKQANHSLTENFSESNKLTKVPAKPFFEDLGYQYIEDSQYIIAVKEGDIIVFYKNDYLVKYNTTFYTPTHLPMDMDGISYIFLESYITVEDDTIQFVKEPCPKHIVTDKIHEKYTYNDVSKDLFEINEHYPQLTNIETIGYSYEGKPIYSMKVSVPTDTQKPKVLLMGNIHAREDFSSKQVMHELDTILYHYYTDQGMYGSYNVKSILDQVDIHFIPVLNPDGLDIAHHGIEASSNYEYLKTINNIAGDVRWWKANARGVDLNANFDDGNWQIKFNPLTSSKVPASEGFKGESPNSEPETKAIQHYCEENLFTLAASYHTSGNLFYWADIDTHGYFDGWDTKIVENLNANSGYRIIDVSQNPSIFGAGFENWFKKRFHRFGLCIELGPSPSKGFVQHKDDLFESLVWEKSKYLGIQLAKDAINLYPYMYDVYQGDQFLKTFYDEDKALTYAKNYSNTKVIHQGNLLYQSTEE